MHFYAVIGGTVLFDVTQLLRSLSGIPVALGAQDMFLGDWRVSTYPANNRETLCQGTDALFFDIIRSHLHILVYLRCDFTTCVG